MHENRNDISRRQLELIPDLHNKRILGIGSAHIAEEKLISDMNLNVTKVDICGTLGGPNILECDACDMPFEDASFDVVICREVIEHVLDDRALLREIQRVLIHGGFLHLTTPNAYNLLPDGKEHLRGYTPVALLEILPKWDFKVVAKEGNPPNIFHGLLPMAMSGFSTEKLLNEFKVIARIMKGQDWSYYVGTMMMVLCEYS